jgi:hypothetical protein
MEVAQVHPLASVFDFDADDFAGLIEIERDIVGDLLRVGPRAPTELYVKRIRIWKVVDSHRGHLGLNRRSGKASHGKEKRVQNMESATIPVTSPTNVLLKSAPIAKKMEAMKKIVNQVSQGVDIRSR